MKTDENGEIVGDPDRIIIFATEDGLIDMLRFRHWAGDATFDSCPELWYQLLTMHCSVGKNYVPRLFCLMPDKKGKTYDRVFEQIKNLGVKIANELDGLPDELVNGFNPKTKHHRGEGPC